MTESHFKRLIHTSPIPTWEQDYSEVVALLETHREAGVENIASHLGAHPDHLDTLIAAIRVRSANQAAVDTYQYDPADNGGRIATSSKGARASFIQQISAIWHGDSELHYEYTRDADKPGPQHCSLHWSVRETAHGPDYSAVAVSIADVTDRHTPASQLQRRVDQLQLLDDFHSEISSQLKLDTVLQTITSGVGRVLGADWVELLVLDEALVNVVERVAIGIDGPGPDAAEIEQGLVRWVLRRRSATISAAIKSDARVTGKALENATASNTGSVVMAPLTIDGRARGTLAAGLVEGANYFAQSDLEAISLMAAYASFAVQNAMHIAMFEDQISTRDRIMASVSHELRTPLTSASGLASALAERWDTTDPVERRELVELIAREVGDARDIVQDLLVSAQTDLGRLPLLNRPIDLAVQVTNVVESLGGVHNTTIEIIGRAAEVIADPVRVRQILRNLISNAIRHGGQHITLEVAVWDEFGSVRVIDNGPGVDAALEDRLFTDFARGDTDLEGSIGLGLSVSRRLAELMGGALSYRRQAELTVFELALPGAPQV